MNILTFGTLVIFFFNSSLCRNFNTKLFKPEFRRSLQLNLVNGYESERRPFYVRLVKRWTNELICGGSIISYRFVLTAAKCLESVDCKSILVEVGDFNDRRSPKYSHGVSRIVTAPSQFLLVKNGNNLALLQLRRPITDCIRIISICITEKEHGTPVATCGLGSTSGSKYSPTKKLREIQLRENKLHKPFSPFVTERRQICREDSVCTTRVTPGGNSCFGDEGNPLYYRNPCFNKSSAGPFCLYGVATEYDSKTNNESEKCAGGSSFARVSHFARWIDFVLWQAAPMHLPCGIF
ncbi:myeloblastin-like [Convolutriloba macropyga]|uniref:myeloblastin-like n=1 Tax=Convolutriloba macropyga TaxID=536237 RepID=UPI003F51B53D